MKYKITFEIDAKGTSYSIKNKKDEVTACIQNIGQWFHSLHLHFLEKKIDRICEKCSPEVKAAILKHLEEDIKLSEQLFNNYTVEGTMEDGNKFTFTHTEPGYKETMAFHEKV